MVAACVCDIRFSSLSWISAWGISEMRVKSVRITIIYEASLFVLAETDRRVLRLVRKCRCNTYTGGKKTPLIFC